MDNNENKPTSRATGPSSSSRRPTSSQPRSTNPQVRPTISMTAEDKLKKSMKGLSHMGAGASNLNLNNNADMSKDSASRKKVGGVVLDMETIQDANKQKLQTKGRRNNVIILVLSLLLVVSIVYLVIAIMGFTGSKKEPNCKFSVEGDASWVIEDGTKTEFLIPQGVTRDMIYLLDTSLQIETNDSVSLYIEVKALFKDEEILIAGLHEHNSNLVRVDGTNKFVYQSTITGGGTITMFKGIDFSEAPANLNSEDLVIEVTAYVEKI